MPFSLKLTLIVGAETEDMRVLEADDELPTPMTAACTNVVGVVVGLGFALPGLLDTKARAIRMTAPAIIRSALLWTFILFAISPIAIYLQYGYKNQAPASSNRIACPFLSARP
jgi:hypothetical protein